MRATSISRSSSTRPNITPIRTIRAPSDRATRTTASASVASAVEQTDWHQIGEDKFAHHAADLLGRLAAGGWVEHIVVIAPPKALGEMRKRYTKAVETRLLGEVNKDLTHLTTAEIGAHLAGD